MNCDWLVIWHGDDEDKTIVLVKLFAMVTLSFKVTWYALRWLLGLADWLFPSFRARPPTSKYSLDFPCILHFCPGFDRHFQQPKSADLWGSEVAAVEMRAPEQDCAPDALQTKEWVTISRQSTLQTPLLTCWSHQNYLSVWETLRNHTQTLSDSFAAHHYDCYQMQ